MAYKTVSQTFFSQAPSVFEKLLRNLKSFLK